MKKSMLVALAALSLAACRNNDDSPSVDNTPVLPTKFVLTEKDGTSTYTITSNFTYNGDHLSQINTTDGSDTSKINFEYTGENITKYTSVDGSDSTTMTFTYANGKIASSTVNTLESNGEYIGASNVSYTYNTDGTVTTVKQKKSTKKSDPTYVYNETITSVFTLVNGQITKIVETNSSTTTPQRTYTYTYDDKNGVFKNIKGFNALTIAFHDELSLFSLTQNNYSVITTKEYANTYVDTYTYEYNNNGYPTKMADNYNNQIPSSAVISYNK